MHTLRPLDPRVTWLWRLQGLLRLAFFWGPISAGLAIWLTSMDRPVPGLLLGLTLGMGALAMALLWPALEYSAFRYAVREHDLLVQRGVLFRRRSAIPLGRIQHVDTLQGPAERLLGLSTLAVYTAAGMSAEGSVPGLAHDEAEALRDALARRGGDDGV